MSEEVVTPETEVPAVAETPAEITSPPAAETTDGDPGDVAADPEQQEADKALKRGKNYYGRKIDQLTREREQVRADNQRLMALLERGLPQAPAAAPKATEEAPKREQYGDIEDFFKAQARFEARQEANERWEELTRAQTEKQRTEALEKQAQGMVETFTKRLDAGKKDYADFDDVVNEASDIEVGNAAAAIAEADHPAGVMYFLAKNPTRAAEIASMSPLKAAIEIGHIDANLKAKPQVSNAPAPGKPVGSKPGSSGSPPDNPDAYMAWASKNLR